MVNPLSNRPSSVNPHIFPDAVPIQAEVTPIDEEREILKIEIEDLDGLVGITLAANFDADNDYIVLDILRYAAWVFDYSIEEQDEEVENTTLVEPTVLYITVGSDPEDAETLMVGFEDENGDRPEDEVILAVLEVVLASYDHLMLPSD